MSGHSKWANIKHQKGIADAKRGQVFTKLIREIIVAVREGGSNPESNYKLRVAVQKARDNNMPIDHIERAIKKGAGELGGATMSEVVLEGYGPSGTAIMVQALTDNRLRTIQDVRSVFTRHGGSLGESGCVAWLFDKRGVIRINRENLDADDVTLKAIDAGAEDVKVEDDVIEVYTKPEELMSVRNALEKQGVNAASAEITMVPKSLVQLEEKAALQTMKMLDKLEAMDEVQSVASNADFDPALIEKYQLQAAA